MDISREILQFLHYHPLSSRDEIAKGTAFEGSDATLKRLIAAGVQNGDIVVEGKARATRYRLSNQAHLLMPLNLDTCTMKSRSGGFALQQVFLDALAPRRHYSAGT